MGDNPLDDPSRSFPGKNGGRLQRGQRSPGDLTQAFRGWARAASASGKVRDRIVQALETEEPFPVKLWQSVADRGFGKPEQHILQVSSVEFVIRDERPELGRQEVPDHLIMEVSDGD